MENLKEEVNVARLYGKECTLPKDEFIKSFKVSEKGLSSKKATDNLQSFGPNEITQAKPKKWYHYFLESLFSPFNCILLGIVIILLYTDVYLAETPSYANIIVIAILVTASTFLDFFEATSPRTPTPEYKSRTILEGSIFFSISSNKQFAI